MDDQILIIYCRCDDVVKALVDTSKTRTAG